MRSSRMTNEQLGAAAEAHRRVANSVFPPDCEPYRDAQIELAEVFEELLDHRLRLGTE
jgi:hypothetical protein